jgi:putative transport protein
MGAMFDAATNWIGRWIPGDSVSQGLAILALVVTIGLFLGAIRVRHMKLGIPGVLFSALLFGQIGLTIDPKVLQFLRDFALILFMYAIGLQVGPGFISSLRTEGLRLNVLSVAVLMLGAAMTAAVGGTLGRSTAPGLYAGAFTTTAGLAAAQESFRGESAPTGKSESAATRTGVAYSITYPFGVIGPVLVIALLRRVFRIRLEDEKSALAAAEDKRRPPIEVVDFEVTESAHAGKQLRNHPLLRNNGVVFSRLIRGDVASVPTGETEILVGDIYRAVGSRVHVEQLVSALGRRSTIDLAAAAGDVQRMELIVTRTQVLRKTLRELDITRRIGVTIPRVTRAGVDLVPSASLRLAFADHVTVVGPKVGLKMVEKELGNCPDTLNRPQLVPIFLGIVVGIVVGSIPLALPGLHATVRIGLAGGPLLAAIALSQFGNIGSIVWYMPVSANQLFRDFGLAVFLACVGLQAGDHFIQRAAQGSGLVLLLWGAAVTVLPVFIVGCFARRVLGMNFITLAGWVAGAMTSSPALLFADEMAKSDAPAVAYAAVAPLATLVPIFCAQLLAITAR